MRYFITCLLAASALGLSPDLAAQMEAVVTSTSSGKHHSGAEFEDFIAREGWIFIQDQTKGAAFPDLEGVPASNGTGEAFSAATFAPATFDPRDFAIPFGEDLSLPTNFRVGDRGMLQFHSAQRCQDLYDRHLARKAKIQ